MIGEVEKCNEAGHRVPSVYLDILPRIHKQNALAGGQGVRQSFGTDDCNLLLCYWLAFTADKLIHCVREYDGV